MDGEEDAVALPVPQFAQPRSQLSEGYFFTISDLDRLLLYILKRQQEAKNFSVMGQNIS
jgi:hypothetical protein